MTPLQNASTMDLGLAVLASDEGGAGILGTVGALVAGASALARVGGMLDLEDISVRWDEVPNRPTHEQISRARTQAARRDLFGGVDAGEAVNELVDAFWGTHIEVEVFDRETGQWEHITDIDPRDLDAAIAIAASSDGMGGDNRVGEILYPAAERAMRKIRWIP